MASNFDELAAKLAGQPGVTNPKALAASIGVKKFGKAGMAKKAAAGRRKKFNKNGDPKIGRIA